MLDLPPMTREEAFETAIIDGINIYVRDALKPKGYLVPEKCGAIACAELVQAKYKIAHDLATKWARMNLDE